MHLHSDDHLNSIETDVYEALENTTTDARISGPISDIFTVYKQVPEPTMIWSPCGVNISLVMRTRITLISNTTTTDTAVFPGTLYEDSPVSTTWQTRIRWRRCLV
ncbi:MAG: hypothetical protein CL912_18810 [Deltaproteobacteria bacterium]|nr:hypothetical protein [Deltaproteobacteria bacterium]